ncbi:MAG: hypothetical protein HC825_02940 [Oscillatoriales cyanobacterium RM1_1_9]|nr:hypothetical protein [Oscillatoriales cyanobacterium RM1_1_9]
MRCYITLSFEFEFVRENYRREITDSIEKRQVLDTFVRETDTLIDLYIDDEVISRTEDHPFWVVNKG